MKHTHQDLIYRMDLEQKCALLSGKSAFGTRAYPKLGIPELQFSDGPHGIRHQDPKLANHLDIGGSLPATCFPTAVTVANSWDPSLAERLGRALGEEAADQGVGAVLGPGLCIKRSPLCGRDFEYLSEDPFLAGRMAAGYVRGIQANGVAACPKHFAANSQETRRQASDSVMDERTLREIYLQGFEIVVREARPWLVMSSYNMVNGVYANENDHLLKQILRTEWGYEGAVVTDWGGSNDHTAGVRAGSTFEMPAPGLDSVRDLMRSVKMGTITQDEIDARVDEALELILKTAPAVQASTGLPFDEDAHHALARDIASQGIVLLKNDAPEGARPLLPLAPGARVALIGDFAQTPRYQGAGSSLVNCTRLDTLRDAVKASDLDCVGFAQGFVRTGYATGVAGGTDVALHDEAVGLARQADVALVCLGLDELAESEGIDRADMRLNQNQIDLLAAVSAANPQVVVLLSAGSSVETGWTDRARSVLYLALGGQAGASAAVDVLTGAVNPSGKLAETWAASLGDTPTYGTFPSGEMVATYREGIYVGYRYYQKARVPVAYPFGYGLSYTTFRYDDVQVSCLGADTELEVSFDLTNTGSVAGAEVAEVYVSKPDVTVFRPVRELKGFAKVYLDPGETRRVRVGLDDRSFSYFNDRTNAWEVEGGTYRVEVGASVEDIRLSARVSVQGTDAPNPYEGRDVTPYETADIRHVSDAQFAALLGHEVPTERFRIDRNVCFRDLGRCRSPIFWVVGAVLRVLKRRSQRAGVPDLNVEFIYNMPIRALAKNAGQLISMGMVDVLVGELRGWGLAGVVPATVVGLLRHDIVIFWGVWTAWFLLPPVWELLVNAVRNAAGERRLARKGN